MAGSDSSAAGGKASSTNGADSSPAAPGKGGARRRSGLGRGLESLLGEYLAEPDPSVPSMRPGRGPGHSSLREPTELPLASIAPNPEQPRRSIDESELKELSQSIQTRGVLQAILVRPEPGGAPDRYQIIAGERRWRAAKQAGLTKIPAMVRSLDDLAVAEIAIIENVQREGLNPMEEAQAYRQLIDRFKHTQESLSTQIGKSRSHIANMMRLLKLPQAVQEKVRKGRLSSGHARTILSASDPEGLAETIVKQKLSVRDAENLVRAETKAKTQARAVREEKPVSGTIAQTGVAEAAARSEALEMRLVSTGSAREAQAHEAGQTSETVQGSLSIFDIRETDEVSPKAATETEATDGSAGIEDDAEIRALEHSLQEMTGLQFGVRRRGGGGEVWISYGNMEELDAICRLLSGSMEPRRGAAS